MVHAVARSAFLKVELPTWYMRIFTKITPPPTGFQADFLNSEEGESVTTEQCVYGKFSTSFQRHSFPLGVPPRPIVSWRKSAVEITPGGEISCARRGYTLIVNICGGFVRCA